MSLYLSTIRDEDELEERKLRMQRLARKKLLLAIGGRQDKESREKVCLFFVLTPAKIDIFMLKLTFFIVLFKAANA